MSCPCGYPSDPDDCPKCRAMPSLGIPKKHDNAVPKNPDDIESLRSENDALKERAEKAERTKNMSMDLLKRAMETIKAYLDEKTVLLKQRDEAVRALLEIRDRWIPALKDIRHEPDKVICDIGQIEYVLARVIPRNKYPDAIRSGEEKVNE